MRAARSTAKRISRRARSRYMMILLLFSPLASCFGADAAPCYRRRRFGAHFDISRRPPPRHDACRSRRATARLRRPVLATSPQFHAADSWGLIFMASGGRDDGACLRGHFDAVVALPQKVDIARTHISGCHTSTLAKRPYFLPARRRLLALAGRRGERRFYRRHYLLRPGISGFHCRAPLAPRWPLRAETTPVGEGLPSSAARHAAITRCGGRLGRHDGAAGEI